MANNDSTTSIKGVCSPSSIMFELWERAAINMSKSDLQWFSQATDNAIGMTTNLQEVIEGICQR
jgi:hypothetical protein